MLNQIKGKKVANVVWVVSLARRGAPQNLRLTQPPLQFRLYEALVASSRYRFASDRRSCCATDRLELETKARAAWRTSFSPSRRARGAVVPAIGRQMARRSAGRRCRERHS